MANKTIRKGQTIKSAHKRVVTKKAASKKAMAKRIAPSFGVENPTTIGS